MEMLCYIDWNNLAPFDDSDVNVPRVESFELRLIGLGLDQYREEIQLNWVVLAFATRTPTASTMS